MALQNGDLLVRLPSNTAVALGPTSNPETVDDYEPRLVMVKMVKSGLKYQVLADTLGITRRSFQVSGIDIMMRFFNTAGPVHCEKHIVFHS
jgi:hypothetical protein